MQITETYSIAMHVMLVEVTRDVYVCVCNNLFLVSLGQLPGGGDGGDEGDKEKEEEAERERLEAIREAEDRRKEKHRKLEEEREGMRQNIRDKVRNKSLLLNLRKKVADK